jgi:hypothetical protein
MWGIRRKVNGIPEPGVCPRLGSRGVRDLDITKRWRITPGFSPIHFYFVGLLAGNCIPSGILSYSRLDPRLGWRFPERAELSVAGRNLLRPAYAEFGDAFESDHTLVERSVAGNPT